MEENTTFCLHCGATNPADAVFCVSCGKSLTEDAPQPVEVPTPAPEYQTPVPAWQPPVAPAKKPFPWLFVGIGVVVVAVIAVAVILLLGNNNALLGKWSLGEGMGALEFTKDGTVLIDGQLFAKYTVDNSKQPNQMTLANAQEGATPDQVIYGIYKLPDNNTLWLEFGTDATTIPTDFSDMKMILTRDTTTTTK